jgi:ABC-type multidrug transport system fused ATPase/permease subunit
LTHNKYDLSEEREAISIENGNFYWDRDDKEHEEGEQNICHLQDINVSVNKGEFVAIVGDIGTGKSSFLYSLLGELKFPDTGIRPRVKINGSMSLVTQKPWIVNETVRNNILFGKEFNRKKYEEVLFYASLKRDLELFTHGDKTMIGEKGATLSGGQKARISFARALYSDSDILLLDDLLSAVDVHVGKFILK